MIYASKSSEALRRLALDVLAGKVWGTWSHEDAADSFLMLKLAGPEEIAAMKAAGIVHAYQHLRYAENRSVNGMPVFLSQEMLDQRDAARLFRLLQRAEALFAAFLAEPEPPPDAVIPVHAADG